MSDKFAQERGILNKLRENINLSGKMLEKISPSFQETMDRLRETDEGIRQQAEGLKDLVRVGKSLVSRRDYLSAAINFSAFHERCRTIASMLEKFKSSVNLKHYKFLLDQFDDEQKEQLFGYDPNKKLAADTSSALIKDAGLSDWWFKITDPVADLAHNLGSQRGAAMRLLEKKFSVAFLKQLKSDSINIANETENYFRYLLIIFKRLATALAKRDMNSYIALSNDFVSKFSRYHDKFVKYHSSNIVPLKEQNDKLIEEVRKMEEEKTKNIEQDAAKAREREKNPHPSVNFNEGAGAPEFKVNEPVKKEVKDNALDKLDETSKDNVVNLKNKAANKQIFKKLEVLATQNNPQVFLKTILAYSEYLENSDPDMSYKLLAVAEGLAEDDQFEWLASKPQNDEENTPKKLEEPPPFELALPERKLAPMKLDMPEGRVEKKYSSIPSLSAIGPSSIRITPASADHIGKSFIKRLYSLGLDDIYEFEDDFMSKLINELKVAIPRGIVLTNNKVEDSHNPLDRQLEIYTYLNMSSIVDGFKGIAKIVIFCRLSLLNKTLSIRTIKNGFTIDNAE